MVPMEPLPERLVGQASMVPTGREHPDKKRRKRRESGSGKQPVS